MTHGFDSGGRRFDAEGRMRDWWTKNDATACRSTGTATPPVS